MGTKTPTSIVAAALLTTVTACSGDRESQSSPPRATATVTATATMTATVTPTPITESAVIPIGDTPPLRMCNTIFGKTDCLESITEMWSKDDLGLTQIDNAYSDLDMLAKLADDAQNPIHDQLVEIIEETDRYLEWVESKAGPSSWDVGAFKGVVTNLTDECGAAFDAAKPKPAPKPEPPKKVTVPGDGVFEVGRDVPPGTYRSPGSKGPGYYCVVYASTRPSDIGTYLRGSSVEGPTIISVNLGEFLNTQFCRPFTKD